MKKLCLNEGQWTGYEELMNKACTSLVLERSWTNQNLNTSYNKVWSGAMIQNISPVSGVMTMTTL